MIRCIICGLSNCGKTNVMISLIDSPHGVCFENVYVYSKFLFQPKYCYVQTPEKWVFREREKGVGKNGAWKDGQTLVS